MYRPILKFVLNGMEFSEHLISTRQSVTTVGIINLPLELAGGGRNWRFLPIRRNCYVEGRDECGDHGQSGLGTKP